MHDYTWFANTLDDIERICLDRLAMDGLEHVTKKLAELRTTAGELYDELLAHRTEDAQFRDA
jgi:hypothetical protein